MIWSASLSAQLDWKLSMVAELAGAEKILKTSGLRHAWSSVVRIDNYVLQYDPAAISFWNSAATSCCFASTLAGLGPDVLRLTKNCCLLDFLGAAAAPLLDSTDTEDVVGTKSACSVTHTDTRTSCWMFHVRKIHKLCTWSPETEARQLKTQVETRRSSQTHETETRPRNLKTQVETRQDETLLQKWRDETETFKNHVSRPRHLSRDHIPALSSFLNMFVILSPLLSLYSWKAPFISEKGKLNIVQRARSLTSPWSTANTSWYCSFAMNDTAAWKWLSVTHIKRAVILSTSTWQNCLRFISIFIACCQLNATKLTSHDGVRNLIVVHSTQYTTEYLYLACN